MITKKNYYKPKLKFIRKLKLISLANLKICKFKKKNWLYFSYLLKDQNKNTKYKKFKIVDLNKILLNKKDRLSLNFKNNFKKNFLKEKIFNYVFGKLKKKYYKKLSKSLTKKLKFKKFSSSKNFILHLFESRLDFILYISKFCSNVRAAKNLISSGYITVNKNIVLSNSFLLNTGDIIKLNVKCCSINFVYSKKWPIIPNYLLVNFKTKEILYLNNSINNNFFF